jgi:hypothetical protein
LFLAEISDFLSDAIEEATNFIIENEVPQVDYTIETSYNLTKSGKINYDEMMKQSYLGRFKNAVRRIVTLNKAKEGKKIRIVELIQFIN